MTPQIVKHVFLVYNYTSRSWICSTKNNPTRDRSNALSPKERFLALTTLNQVLTEKQCVHLY